MKNKYQKRQEWFTSHIGKRIYRNSTTCKCGICVAVGKRGLLIHDEMHAEYLHDIEGGYTHDGFPLQYFDTKWEAILFGVKSRVIRMFKKKINQQNESKNIKR